MILLSSSPPHIYKAFLLSFSERDWIALGKKKKKKKTSPFAFLIHLLLKYEEFLGFNLFFIFSGWNITSFPNFPYGSPFDCPAFLTIYKAWVIMVIDDSFSLSLVLHLR
jgi:hypothetical protein